jgi:chemotaxis signal transduction protein
MLKLLTVRATEVSPVLVVMVGTRACAFPLHHVAETMRPLPIQPVAGTPSFVRGVSVIRGTPTPVVDLKALLENSENGLSKPCKKPMWNWRVPNLRQKKPIWRSLISCQA